MQVGSFIPASVQLVDYNNAKYPSAVVFDDTVTPIGSPLPLALVSNGFYANNSLAFPDIEFAIVQLLTYDDAGRTILSTSEGGQLAVFYRDGSPQGTQIAPLAFQLATYLTSKFVRAVVRNDIGATIATKNLTAGPNGLYTDITVQFPASTSFLSVQYLVYDDAGYTVLSASQGAGFGLTFLVPPPSSALPSNTGLVGILDSLLVNPVNGIQDEVVTGSDRILNARLTRNDNGDPYDLVGATEVAFRFLNEDMTVTVIKMTDPGAPVQVTSAAAGRLSCSITKEQSALFMPGSPAPFSVVVTQPGGTIVCNFPYQLQVSEEINQ